MYMHAIHGPFALKASHFQVLNSKPIPFTTVSMKLKITLADYTMPEAISSSNLVSCKPYSSFLLYIVQFFSLSHFLRDKLWK